MEWLAIPIVLFLIWGFFNLNVFWRRQKRSDISHAVWSMLVNAENGGWLSIKARNSPVAVKIVREGGFDSTATLSLCVPKEWWAYAAEEELRKIFDAHGYEADFGTHSTGRFLCEIRFNVTDIWNEAAGAPVARLVDLVLDAVGVPRDARFKLDISGPESRRLYDHEWSESKRSRRERES